MPQGRIVERYLDINRASARVECPSDLVPLPGQYLLAFDPNSDETLATPLFSAGNTETGFLAASTLPGSWQPGISITLRGPFGHGYLLPSYAQRVALIAWDAPPTYLLGLIPIAQRQGAAISLICENPPENLPVDLAIDPSSALGEISQWADYMAVVASRAAIRGWRQRFSHKEQLKLPREAQALVVISMPCGGLAKCGVCSVETRGGNSLVCEDGPVFQLDYLV